MLAPGNGQVHSTLPARARCCSRRAVSGCAWGTEPPDRLRRSSASSFSLASRPVRCTGCPHPAIDGGSYCALALSFLSSESISLSTASILLSRIVSSDIFHYCVQSLYFCLSSAGCLWPTRRVREGDSLSCLGSTGTLRSGDATQAEEEHPGALDKLRLLSRQKTAAVTLTNIPKALKVAGKQVHWGYRMPHHKAGRICAVAEQGLASNQAVDNLAADETYPWDSSPDHWWFGWGARSNNAAALHEMAPNSVG